MHNLTSSELINVSGGSFYTPFDFVYKIYRTIRIKWLMKQVFID